MVVHSSTNEAYIKYVSVSEGEPQCRRGTFSKLSTVVVLRTVPYK
jgi:hypothetical protein